MIKGEYGKVYIIPSSPFDGGGEGLIYTLSDEKIAKIYLPDILSNQRDNREVKIRYMIEHPPVGKVLDYVAWPIDVLYDDGKFCGFVMNNLQGFRVMKSIHSVSVRDTEPLGLKIQCALNLSITVDAVHNAGYIIGDFHSKNVGFDSLGNICLYDIDSLQFRNDNGHTFRCTVQVPEYVAPEILIETHTSDISVGFTEDTDHFALAVHIFQLMMNGQLPYRTIRHGCHSHNSIPSQSISESSNSDIPKGNEDVINDRYCFRSGYRPYCNITPSNDLFPEYIMDLFDRAFHILGAGEHRPTAKEWIDALDKYHSDIIPCQVDCRHMYWRSASVCPYCDASERQRRSQSNMRSDSMPSNVL